MGAMTPSDSRPRATSPLPLPCPPAVVVVVVIVVVVGSCSDLGRALPGRSEPLRRRDDADACDFRLLLRSLLLPRRKRSISSTCLCKASMQAARTFAPPILSARSDSRWARTSRLSWVTSSAALSEDRESVLSSESALLEGSSAGSTAILTGPEPVVVLSWWLVAPCRDREADRLDDENCGRRGERFEMWKFIWVRVPWGGGRWVFACGSLVCVSVLIPRSGKSHT